MVKKTKNKTADDKIKNNRTSKVLDYASHKTTNPKIHITDSNSSDDIIISLADAHENKRARQVIEWESMQRKAFYKAA